MYNINEDFELTDKGIDLQAAQRHGPTSSIKGLMYGVSIVTMRLWIR